MGNCYICQDVLCNQLKQKSFSVTLQHMQNILIACLPEEHGNRILIRNLKNHPDAAWKKSDVHDHDVAVVCYDAFDVHDIQFINDTIEFFQNLLSHVKAILI